MKINYNHYSIISDLINNVCCVHSQYSLLIYNFRYNLLNLLLIKKDISISILLIDDIIFPSLIVELLEK